MMKKILIAIAVIILLGVSAYFYLDNLGQKELANYEEEIKIVKASSTAATTLTDYTMTEVSVHNKKSDCWLVINGQVANVTNFIDKHPGGERILEGCGKDATLLFNSIPEHAKGLAVIVLKSLIIGEVKK